ncbi:MAG: S8 family serine peptidase [Myxococcota bacterium]
MRRPRHLICAGALPAILIGFASPAQAAVRDNANVWPAGWSQPTGDNLVEYLEGDLRVLAERVDGAVRAARGTNHRAVLLRYPDLDLEVPAAVDRYAIATTRTHDPAEAATLMTQLGATLVRPLMPAAGLWLISGREHEDGLATAARLTPTIGDALVGVTPDVYLEHTLKAAPPNDERFPDQWYFDNLDMLAAWDLHMGDPAVTIVVIDNGCDTDHPDLFAKMDAGWDTIDQDDDPNFFPNEPGNAHGTACAGLVGAATNNGIGMAGACPNCHVRCVRLLGGDGVMVPASADIEAFNFALDIDADVVSNSWGFAAATAVPQALADAIDTVFTSGRGGYGALVIFASGNDNRELGDNELESLPSVLAVGAVDRNGDKAPFTNFGASLDLTAPTGTLTTDIVGSDGSDLGDYTETFGGTSASCPIVAGVAGLLASAAPTKTSAELYDVLTGTAKQPLLAQPDAFGHDPIYGYGIIDPRSALARVITVTPPPHDEEGCDCSGSSAGLLAAAIAGMLLRGRRRR